MIVTPLRETHPPFTSTTHCIRQQYPDVAIEILSDDRLRLLIKQEAWTPDDMDFFSQLYHQGSIDSWELTGFDA
jgi:hypothetical protein